MNVLKDDFKDLWEILKYPFFLIGTVIFVLLSFYLRKTGLNPKSLWLDDAWVALAGKVSNFEQLRTIIGSSPIGFALLIKVLHSVIHDPEISVQILPFFSGLILIPFLGIVLKKVTGNVYLALSGSFIISISPPIALYSIRVKQFTFDALMVTFFLLISVCILGQKKSVKEDKKFIYLCLSSLLLGVFSYTSLFFSGILIGVLFLKDLFLVHKKKRKLDYKKIYVFILYLGSLLLMYVFLLKGQTNNNLQNYWKDSFLPYNDGFSRIIKFYIAGIFNFITKAFPVYFGNILEKEIYFFNIGYYLQFLVIIFFMLLGFLYLFKSSNLKVLGISLFLFYLVPIFLSAVHKYPLGAKATRLEIYSYPLTIFLFFTGAHCFYTLIKKTIFEREVALNGKELSKYFTEQMVSCIFLSFLIMMMIILIWNNTKRVYYTSSEQCISEAVSLVERNEGNVIVYPLASMAFGYYTKEAVDFVSDSGYSSGFNIKMNKENYHVLPFIRGFRSDPTMLEESLRNIPYEEYDDIYYIASHYSNESSNYIEDFILNNGDYKKETVISSNSCKVEKFTK